MPLIRKMVAKDATRLHTLFPEKPESRFDDYYVEQLTEKRVVFVAYDKADKDKDSPLRVYGYVTLMWESHYTQFWRRNIPEIVDLNVGVAFRNQGIGRQLIAACESAARTAGYGKIGISVVQDDPTYAAANHLYPTLGYEPDGFGITPDDNELHLWKAL